MARLFDPLTQTLHPTTHPGAAPLCARSREKKDEDDIEADDEGTDGVRDGRDRAAIGVGPHALGAAAQMGQREYGERQRER